MVGRRNALLGWIIFRGVCCFQGVYLDDSWTSIFVFFSSKLVLEVRWETAKNYAPRRLKKGKALQAHQHQTLKFYGAKTDRSKRTHWVCIIHSTFSRFLSHTLRRWSLWKLPQQLPWRQAWILQSGSRKNPVISVWVSISLHFFRDEKNSSPQVKLKAIRPLGVHPHSLRHGVAGVVESIDSATGTVEYCRAGEVRGFGFCVCSFSERFGWGFVV